MQNERKGTLIEIMFVVWVCNYHLENHLALFTIQRGQTAIVVSPNI